MDIVTRHPSNPLIRPSDVKPSTEGYQVLGSFNPAAVEFDGDIILLLRVAESCVPEDGYVSVPYYRIDDSGSFADVLRVREDDPDLVLKDTRGIFYRGADYLSTLSHIRLARSHDGVQFRVEEKPFLFPTLESEAFGVEDARISHIGDEYWITYTGVSRDGFCTMLALTRDFVHVEKKGIIFSPMNKDVAIFERQCGGSWYCFHRPNNDGFGRPSIWIARSHDLIHWGEHSCIIRPQNNRHESLKIGGGAPPVLTDEGWLAIYHGKGDNQRYSLNTLLLDPEHPEQVIGRGKAPLLEPEEPYETDGFFGNVVFTNGMIIREVNGGKEAWIYYGASDETSCLAVADMDNLVRHARGRI